MPLRILAIACLLAFMSYPSLSSAQPTLSVSALNGGKTLRFSRSAGDGCTYSLGATTSRRGLSRGKTSSITSNLAQDTLAESLPRLRGKGKRRVRVYFLLSERCGESEAQTTSTSIRLRAAKGRRGKSFRKFISRLSSNLSLANSSIRLTRIFENVTFERPVDLANAGDARLFVVEQGGIISVFENASSQTKNTFLDLTSKTAAEGERGLFSIAFHQNYSRNGFFFVHYSDISDGATVIERYQVSNSDENVANPDSGVEFLRLAQPFANHNGGEMEFGPDGFLYISLGDGGSGGDPLGSGQDRTTLLGNILRIDVDSSSSEGQYSIPGSNPFAGNSDGFREEIFAYGARNIWKFSFDADTGVLWAGDVGQGAREEVSQVPLGANLGWKTTEGFLCFEPETDCDQTGIQLPVIDYPRSDGTSITGGFVYRGTNIPGLIGNYVFADFLGPDFGGGVIWSFPIADNSPEKAVLDSEPRYIAAFGQDVNNELYVLTFNEGGPIYRIDPAS